MIMKLDAKQMRYDVFLAGPWEQYAKESYKDRLKSNLPHLKFYDPEIDSGQINGTWFEDNYVGIKKSKLLVSHECTFPGAGTTRETGIYYGMYGDGKNPLENLVIIFFKDLQPDFGIEVAKKMGIVVYNVTEAENYIKRYFENNKKIK